MAPQGSFRAIEKMIAVPEGEVYTLSPGTKTRRKNEEDNPLRFLARGWRSEALPAGYRGKVSAGAITDWSFATKLPDEGSVSMSSNVVAS